MQDRTLYKILFSCTGEPRVGFDAFTESHSVSYIISGVFVVTDAGQSVAYPAGSILLVSKNQLIKGKKLYHEGEPFRSISVFLSQESLFRFAQKNKIVPPEKPYTAGRNILLKQTRLLEHYFRSLTPYVEEPSLLTDNMARLKTYELIEILSADKSLDPLLFRFDEGFKLDLEAHMNHYYTHRATLEEFAKATGRSLSAFKRDFKQIFNTNPSGWLMQKRLELAHYLISQQDRKPSDVYLEVGFADFSHFSKAYKAKFGFSPSETPRTD